MTETSQQITVSLDDLCHKLNRMTTEKSLKNFYSDILNKPRNGMKFTRQSPVEAVMYFDHYFNYGIPRDVLISMDEDDACNILFDIAHFPSNLVHDRFTKMVTYDEIAIDSLKHIPCLYKKNA